MTLGGLLKCASMACTHWVFIQTINQPPDAQQLHVLARTPHPMHTHTQDGSPTTWSQQELSDIFAIWRSVSEDYSPFDVDITTGVCVRPSDSHTLLAHAAAED